MCAGLTTPLSGTSVGDNVRKASVSQSKKEFIAKMNIALKEIHESQYWLELLKQSGCIADHQCQKRETDQLIRDITSIIKTSNESLK